MLSYMHFITDNSVAWWLKSMHEPLQDTTSLVQIYQIFQFIKAELTYRVWYSRYVLVNKNKEDWICRGLNFSSFHLSYKNFLFSSGFMTSAGKEVKERNGSSTSAKWQPFCLSATAAVLISALLRIVAEIVFWSPSKFFYKSGNTSKWWLVACNSCKKRSRYISVLHNHAGVEYLNGKIHESIYM